MKDKYRQYLSHHPLTMPYSNALLMSLFTPKRFYSTPLFNKSVIVTLLENQKVNNYKTCNKPDNKKIFKFKKNSAYENMYSCLPFKNK